MTTTRFTAIDLKKVPLPDFVEPIDTPELITLMRNDVKARLDEAGYEYDAEELEGDMVSKILEVAAYWVSKLQARANDGAKAASLGHSQAGDLDRIHGDFFKTPRHELKPATSDTPALMEADGPYRERIGLAPEAWSTCGPHGSYIYHAHNAAEGAFKNVAVLGEPGSGRVEIILLSHESEEAGVGADGVPSDDQVLAVVRYFQVSRGQGRNFSGDNKIPFTDIISVRKSKILTYEISAKLKVGYGASPDLLVGQATGDLEDLVEDHHKIGVELPYKKISKASLPDGTLDVEIIIPATDADIIPADDTAPFCTGIAVSYEVVE